MSEDPTQPTSDAACVVDVAPQRTAPSLKRPFEGGYFTLSVFREGRMISHYEGYATPAKVALLSAGIDFSI